MATEAAMLVVIGLIILLLVFGISAIAGTEMGKYIFGLINPYLSGSGSGSQTHYDDVAYRSVDILSCAVNSVAKGTADQCLSRYQKPSDLTGAIIADGWTDEYGPGLTTQNGLTGFAADSSSPLGILSSLGTGSGGKSASDSSNIDTKSWGKSEIGWVDCNSGATKCTVHNFQLPQYVSKAEERIIGYGDPDYLVYWNMFPVEEDTWTYKPDWRIHVIAGAVSIIPFGRLTYVGVKLGLKAVTQQSVKAALKSELMKMISSRFLKKQVKSVFIKGVVIEAASVIAELADSMNAKYEPAPNTIAFRSPYQQTQKFALPAEWKGNLVLNYWQPEVRNVMSNAYFASPCYLNEFTIEKGFAVCDQYTYNGENGADMCSSPRKDTSKMECGVFDKKADDFVGWPVYDTTTAVMKSSEKRIYERGTSDPSNGWKYDTKKLFLPWQSAVLGRSGTFFLSDFRFIQTSGHGVISQEFNDYDAAIYNTIDNKQVLTLTQAKGGDVVMLAGKEYILHVYVKSGTLRDSVGLDIYSADANPCNLEHFMELQGGKYVSCDAVTKSASAVISEMQYITSKGAGLFADVITIKMDLVRRFTPSANVKVEELLAEYTDRGATLLGDRTMSIDDIRYAAPMRTDFSCRTSKTSLSGSLVMGPWKERTMYCEAPFFGTSFSYNSSADYMKAVASSDGRSDIKEDFKGIFSSSSFTLDKGTSDTGDDYYVFQTDEDGDGKWDIITIRESSVPADYSTIANAILGKDADLIAGRLSHNMISLSGIDSEGKPKYITMANCQKPAVIIDLGKIEDKKSSGYKDNYCVRSVSTTNVILKWGGRIAGTGLLIAATFVSGGSALGAYALAATAAAAEAAGEINYEYSNAWP